VEDQGSVPVRKTKVVCLCGRPR